jgi:Transcriptional regulatory protein, C terminal
MFGCSCKHDQPRPRWLSAGPRLAGGFTSEALVPDRLCRWQIQHASQRRLFVLARVVTWWQPCANPAYGRPATSFLSFPYRYSLRCPCSRIGPNNSYKGKPFRYPELRARINAVLRRREARAEGPTRVGDLVIDPVRHRVTVGERVVPLSKKEFALLRALAANPTRVYTKEELLKDIWAYKGNSKTRTLDSHASRLRRKLDPEGGRFVFNCWGIGYRLIDG